MTAIALWPGGAVICWSSTADCYGKLCQTQPLIYSYANRSIRGLPLVESHCDICCHLQQSWGGRVIWSKTVLVWSRLEIFVDSGQNQRLQYFRGWTEKRDRPIRNSYWGFLVMFQYWNDQWRILYRGNLTGRDWEVEEGGDVFDGSRSEILQVEDAEFVRAKCLTIPTALDCSPH